MSNNKFEVSLVDADSPSRNVAVLRIASATRNSESQFYVRRIQVSKQNLESLHKKVIAKLALHQINDVNVALTIQLAKDRAITFTSLEQLLAYDVNVEAWRCPARC